MCVFPYVYVVIVFEGFAVVDFGLIGSTEEAITHLTEETCLWDQELHACTHGGEQYQLQITIK